MRTQSILFFLLLSTSVNAQWNTQDESNALRTKISAELQSNESEEIVFGIIHLGDSWEWYLKGIPVWSKVQYKIGSSTSEEKKYKTSTKYNRHLISGLAEDDSFKSSIYSDQELALTVTKGQSTNTYTFHTDNAQETIEEVFEKGSIEIEASEDALQPMTNSTSNDVFKIVDEMPFFDQCEDKNCSDEKLIKFVESNVKYPNRARRRGIEGRVFVQFIVEKDGKVSGAKVIRDIGGGCGQAALKVVEMMNTKTMGWSPGVQRGQNVRVLYTLPVTFKFEQPLKTKRV